MKDLDYSFHAARAFLLTLVLLLGGAGIGNHLGGNRGAFTGFLTGGLLLGIFAVVTRNRPRDESWVQLGRNLGLRSAYSGHVPPIPLPEHDEILDVLAGSLGPVSLIIGDRQRRYLVRPRRTSGSQSSEPYVSGPVPVETILALWVPGLQTAEFSLGKRRSLWGDSEVYPSGPESAALLSWSKRNRDWRVEGAGECLVMTRPGRFARSKDLAHWLEQARSLVSGLPVENPQEPPSA